MNIQLKGRWHLGLLPASLLLLALIFIGIAGDGGDISFTDSYKSLATAWTQTSWIGSSGQSNWSDSTKYSSESNIDDTVTGVISVLPISDWYDVDWKYRKKITFDNSAQTENLTDFPVLVKLDDVSDIDYSKTQNSGEDVRFTDSDGVTLLSYEIERWNESGSSYVWVKVPQVDAISSADYIYIYYGNATASSAESPSTVWENGYLGSWHLAQDPTGGAPQITDVVSSNHGTVAGSIPADALSSTISGQGLTFDGVDDYIDIANESNFDITGSITVEAWVKPSTSLTTQYIIGKGAQDSSDSSYALVYEGAPTSKWKFYMFDSTNHNTAVSNNDLSLNVWNYVVGIYDQSEVSIYINGVKQTDTTSATASINVNNEGVTFGSYQNGLLPGGYVSGQMDEMRISDTVRSPSWIAATYKAIQDTFNTFGVVEKPYPSSASITSSIFDSGQISDWGILSATTTTPTSTALIIKFRTGSNSDLSGATAFASCSSVAIGSDLTDSNACATDGHRYAQYQMSLTSNSNIDTPTISDISFAHEATPGPVISSTGAVATSTGVNITWTTNISSSSKVEYGFTNTYGSLTTETDTSPRVKNHSIFISSLASCITYNYRVISTDILTNTTTGSNKTFTTQGCIGNATVLSSTVKSVTKSSGGSVSALESGKGALLNIPANYSDEDAVFQVNKLDKSSVLTNAAAPSNQNAIGDHVYDFKALSGSNSITSFAAPITITVSYDEADVGNINESSLKIKRWNGTEWKDLDNCSVNTVENEITCTTNNFSTFALMGDVTETAAVGDADTEVVAGTDAGEGEESSSRDITWQSALLLALLAAGVAIGARYVHERI